MFMGIDFGKLLLSALKPPAIPCSRSMRDLSQKGAFVLQNVLPEKQISDAFLAFTSGSKENFPDERIIRSLLQNPLYQLVKQQIGQSLPRDKIEDFLSSQLLQSNQTFLKEIHKRIFTGAETIQSVLLDLWEKNTEIIPRASLLGLCVDYAYGHGRNLLIQPNIKLLGSFIDNGSTILDIGAGCGYLTKKLSEVILFKAKNVSIRAFDNLNPTNPYNRYWLTSWFKVEPIKPVDSLFSALQQPNNTILFSYPHVNAKYPQTCVEHFKGKNVILYLGNDFPSTDTNAGINHPLFQILLRKRFFQLQLPSTYAEELKRFPASVGKLLLFSRD
jgi:hypothetical protein